MLSNSLSSAQDVVHKVCAGRHVFIMKGQGRDHQTLYKRSPPAAPPRPPPLSGSQAVAQLASPFSVPCAMRCVPVRDQDDHTISDRGVSFVQHRSVHTDRTYCAILYCKKPAHQASRRARAEQRDRGRGKLQRTLSRKLHSQKETMVKRWDVGLPVGVVSVLYASFLIYISPPRGIAARAVY